MAARHSENPDVLAEQKFRREQLEAKRLRALALARDPERTRRYIRGAVGVSAGVLNRWLDEAGIVLPGGRRA